MSKSMTPERTIEILKNLTFIKVLENNAHSNIAVHSESTCKKDNEDFAAIQMAISALEKQIPKKPDYEGDGYDENGNLIYDTWICPNCGRHYEVDYDDYDFCPDCGQAIDKALDWSDENG